MKAADPIDTARLSLALTDLRLPAIKLVWPDVAARSDKEGWPAARFLAALAEHEMAERARRRMSVRSRWINSSYTTPWGTTGNRAPARR